MNPYLNILKSKTGVPGSLPKGSKAPFAPYEPEGGTPFPEIVTPSEPFEPMGCTPVSEITVPSSAAKQTWSADEWMAMIAELDGLIAEFRRRFYLSPDAHARILAIRHQQPRYSIPGTLEWFRRELGGSDAAQGKDRP